MSDTELLDSDVIEFNGEQIQVSSLMTLDDVSRNRMLAEIEKPEEAAEFLKMAKAAKAAAIRLELDKKERDRYAELVLWGLRKLGEMTKDMDKAKGGNPTGNNQYGEWNRDGSRLSSSVPTFVELGIDPHDVEYGRKFVKLPEDRFRQCIEQEKEKGNEPTITAVYREAKKFLQPETVQPQPEDWTATTANVYFAQICNAIEEYDSEWLLSEDCRFYFELLKLPYTRIRSWAKAGCEPKSIPMHEVQISFLKAEYKPPEIDHDKETIYAAR
jgi:hypothetical protein